VTDLNHRDKRIEVAYMFVGDLFAIVGTLLRALSNVLTEKFLKNGLHPSLYSAWIGMFGFAIVTIEALITFEYPYFAKLFQNPNSGIESCCFIM
jgi:drug/metabolite transporter (DMT)-like permease